MSSSRMIWRTVRFATLLTAAVVLAAATGGAATAELAGVRTSVLPGATTFFLRIASPVNYSPTWVDSRTFALDMAGASTRLLSHEQLVHSPLVSAYRVFTYEGADDKPHVRVELALKTEAKVDAEKSQGGVALRVHQDEKTSAKAEPRTAPDPAPVAAAAPAAPSARTRRGSSIQEVQVAKLEGTTQLEVQVIGNGSLEYRTLRLKNPERLVLDIPNATNRVRLKQLRVNTAPLRAVRVGQLSRSPLVSRVVMDLDSTTDFQVRKMTSSLVVTLGSARPPAAAKDAPEKNNSAPAGSPELAPDKLEGKKAAANLDPSNVSPQDQSQENGGMIASAENAPAVLSEPAPAAVIAPSWRVASDITPAEPSSPAPVAAQAAPAPVAVEAAPAPQPAPEPAVAVLLASAEPSAEASLAMPPAHATAPHETQEMSAPVVASPDSHAAPAAPISLSPEKVAVPAPLARQKSGTAAADVLLAQAGTPPEPQMPGMAQAAPPARPAYTGEPISVNLKDVDLKDFFRLIHEISGLNVVLDPTVSGNVTVVLDEVPWDQAMEIVMRNNGLGKEVEGSVVRIAKLTTLEAEEKQHRDLAAAIEGAQPKVTVTRTLSYAKAADLIPTLKKFASERGDIVSDARTNSLIITDIPNVITQLDRLIKGLDQKSMQVEIEARVVSASRSFARDIGIQLAASGLTGNVVLGGTGLVGASAAKARGAAAALLTGGSGSASGGQPLSVNLPIASTPTGGFTFLLNSGNNFALDAIINAAEARGVGRLLSRPKIITQNNVVGEVKQGVKLPVQTTVNNTISTQFIDVVLRLTVTPQITADGTIFLVIEIENSSIDAGIARINGTPAIDTQNAKTQVLVSNGGTVFFGGVIQNINSVTEQQVPLLGSMPLIGNLFRRKATSSSTNELLFFITPRIVQS